MRCKDCKFYEPLPAYPNFEETHGFGTCEKTNVDDFTEKDKIVDTGERESVFVGENFGCIHFKQKENEAI